MGNLKQTTLQSGAVHTFDHDGLDRRVTKSIGSTLQWRAVYEDKLRIAAYVNNTSGTLSKEFIYATRVNVPDYMVSGGVKYRIITDHLGSPRLMAKTTDGTIAQRMDYNVLGEVKADTNPSFQPFGFAGGDTNLYGYVLNDPVNDFDPSGMFGWIAAIRLAAAGACMFADVKAGLDTIGLYQDLGMEIEAIGQQIKDLLDNKLHSCPNHPLDEEINRLTALRLQKISERTKVEVQGYAQGMAITAACSVMGSRQ